MYHLASNQVRHFPRAFSLSVSDVDDATAAVEATRPASQEARRKCGEETGILPPFRVRHHAIRNASVRTMKTTDSVVLLRQAVHLVDVQIQTL